MSTLFGKKSLYISATQCCDVQLDVLHVFTASRHTGKAPRVDDPTSAVNPSPPSPCRNTTSLPITHTVRLSRREPLVVRRGTYTRSRCRLRQAHVCASVPRLHIIVILYRQAYRRALPHAFINVTFLLALVSHSNALSLRHAYPEGDSCTVSGPVRTGNASN